MTHFDPWKPGQLVHDKLNDQVIEWRSEPHGSDYQAGHRDRRGRGRVGRSCCSMAGRDAGEKLAAALHLRLVRPIIRAWLIVAIAGIKDRRPTCDS